MKRSLIALAAAAAIGATALGTTLSFAHSDDDGPGGRPGWGMMGPGMMGGGYGPGYGMMGGGYGMGPQMMGYAQGNGNFPCPAYDADDANAKAEPLSLEAAKKVVEQRLAWMGNDRLKLGKIEAKGDNAFTAEIVTQDNSLVQKLEINRNTGFMHPVR